MTPRLDHFSGTDVEYICYLEACVLALRNRLGDEEPPGRPGDLGAINYEQAQTAYSNVERVERSIPECRTTGNALVVSAFENQRVSPDTGERRKRAKSGDLEFISFRPQDVPRKANPVPRWRHPARELIRETPSATQWISRLRETGLYEAMEGDHALAYLLDTAVTPDMAVNEKKQPNDTLDHVRQYARAAAMRSVKASVALKLANFQKFLVLSACAVLLN